MKNRITHRRAIELVKEACENSHMNNAWTEEEYGAVLVMTDGLSCAFCDVLDETMDDDAEYDENGSMIEKYPDRAFHEDDRVRLKADVEEGWDEELATVCGPSGDTTYIVRVDDEFREFNDSDGLREVTDDQMELIDDEGEKR